MTKPAAPDDLALLSRRFEDLINKVQSIMDELGAPKESPPEVNAQPDERAYSIQTPASEPDAKRSKALIRAIDGMLKDLDTAMDPDRSRPIAGDRQMPLFTPEEILFLKESLTKHTSDKHTS